MVYYSHQFGWHYHERRTALSLLSHLKVIETEVQLPWAARSFMQTLLSLEAQKAKIEDECGERLSWYPVEGEKRIAFRRADVDVTDETDWPNQHEWLASKFEKLNEVFRPRIERMRR